MSFMKSCVAVAALALVATVAPTAPAAAKPAVCKPKRLDLTLQIAGVDVLNGDLAGKLIKRDYKTVQTDPQTDFPWAVFLSTDRTQSLALMHHPGGLRFDFNEAEIRVLSLPKSDELGKDVAYYIGRETRDQSLPAPEFVTGQGIKLGVTKRFVTARLGACSRVFKTRRDMETIRYELQGENHPLLKKTGMPSYYGEYQFRRGKLVRFRFGFDYP